MIDEALLNEWALKVGAGGALTKEQVLMLISQLKTYQRNSTNIFVFPQTFFDVADNKIGTPSDTIITPEKLRGFVLEQAVNADYYFVANSKIMPQDAPPTQPPPNVPTVAPAPQWLYRARVDTDFLNIRDAQGEDSDEQGNKYGTMGRDEIVDVWEVVEDIGGYKNRAVITSPLAAKRFNVWAAYLQRI
jgi:hypothetical protein